MTPGRVFNIQRFSVHDGPGLRTTVFLKGCPLRCLWCHNPEGMRPAPELVLVTSRCIHCGQCVAACPSGRLAAVERGDADVPRCRLCGTCVDVCPAEARQWVGRPMTVDEVVAEVLKDRIFYDDSGGGVTFSGGEPLMQPRFLNAALAACKREGVRTAVDTCGFCRRDDLLAAARWTDLFLFDLKVMDGERHRRLTGVSNATILENLEALARVHDDVRIRIPVIPGLNDDRDNVTATVRFVAALPGVRRVNLLPFHANGHHKRERLAGADPAPHLYPPSAIRMDELAAAFTDAGLETRIGG